MLTPASIISFFILSLGIDSPLPIFQFFSDKDDVSAASSADTLFRTVSHILPHHPDDLDKVSPEQGVENKLHIGVGLAQLCEIVIAHTNKYTGYKVDVIIIIVAKQRFVWIKCVILICRKQVCMAICNKGLYEIHKDLCVFVIKPHSRHPSWLLRAALR